jgi:hypothetical protein
MKEKALANCKSAQLVPSIWQPHIDSGFVQCRASCFPIAENHSMSYFYCHINNCIHSTHPLWKGLSSEATGLSETYDPAAILQLFQVLIVSVLIPPILLHLRLTVLSVLLLQPFDYSVQSSILDTGNGNQPSVIHTKRDITLPWQSGGMFARRCTMF